MIFLRILLSSSIICIVTIASSTVKKSKIVKRSELDYSLEDIWPLHYNILLSLSGEYFICDNKITIYIVYTIQRIKFHILNPKGIGGFIKTKLQKIEFNDRMSHYNKTTIYYDKNNNVVLNYNKDLLPGMYHLQIRIEFPMNTLRIILGTPYINDAGDIGWFITNIQPKKLQIFPVWDHSELMLPFEMSIIHQRRYKALSNTPITNTRFVDSNTIQTYFENGSISTHDIAFVMHDFHRINLYSTINMWCAPQLIPYVDFAQRIIKNATMYIEKYWNNSKRFIFSPENKVDHVVIPNLQDEVKQILGFVFYRETDIIYDKELDPVARKIIIARLIARKMALKYIGNILKPFSWFQLWLSKGLIIFFQTYIIDKIKPDFRMMELFKVQVQHELLDLNTYVNINSEVEHDNYSKNYMYIFLFYNKGSIIWHMLERTLLPNIFLKGINIYLNEYAKPKEKTFNNLWKVMESVIDELDVYYQFDVRSTVSSWAKQRCFPVLEVMRNNSSNIVTISAQFYNKLDEEQYYIPITYTTESEHNFIITWSNIWLTSSESQIEFFLEKDQWVIFNLQQAGYYRVNYDIDNWQKIARYLNSEEYKNIHVLNRAQIIDDAFHFAVEKKLKSSIFWELATYLQKEKDYIAWYPMLKAIEFMSNIFPFSTVYPYLKKMLKPLELTWNVYSEDSDDDHMECLKQELAKWKCITHDISCKTNANEQLQRHLNKQIKLSPGWKRWTYCNGLKTANISFWKIVNLLRSFFLNNDQIFLNNDQTIREEIDYTILECLAYNENADNIISFFKNILPNMYFPKTYYYQIKLMQVVRQNDALTANIFLSFLVKNSGHMLEYMLDHFSEIVPRHVSKVTALAVIINNSYTKENLARVKQFIEKEIKGPIFSDVERKIETRWLQIKRQIKFFQSLFID